jgi:hypothetical protein
MSKQTMINAAKKSMLRHSSGHITRNVEKITDNYIPSSACTALQIEP